MNQQTNWLSWVGNSITTVAAVLGITTLELAYLIIAVLGFLLTFISWLDKRRSIRTERQSNAERLNLDRQRTRAIVDFLGKSDKHDLSQADDVVAKVQRVMDETEIQTQGPCHGIDESEA
ncbi:hypothetical protein [Klebsiella indica]|uniref:hypothetical protein n=1 Tax=Klebsiella indica TaxID=2582917 RepID=UPI0031B6C9B3